MRAMIMKVFIRVFIQMDRKSAGHFVSVPKSSRWAARTPPRVGVTARAENSGRRGLTWRSPRSHTLIAANGGGVAARIIAAAIFQDMGNRLGRTEPRPAATRGQVGPKASVAAKPRIAMRANKKRVRSDPASKARQSLQTRFRFATTHLERTLEPNEQEEQANRRRRSSSKMESSLVEVSQESIKKSNEIGKNRPIEGLSRGW